jgi:hypothetical protein
VPTEPEPLPADLATAHAMILALRDARQRAEGLVSAATLEIERLKLLLAPRGSSDPRRFAAGSEDRWPVANGSVLRVSAAAG